jgi:hypothetical protein
MSVAVVVLFVGYGAMPTTATASAGAVALAPLPQRATVAAVTLPIPGLAYHIVNYATHKCMNNPYASHTPGTTIAQYTCTSASTEAWAFNKISNYHTYEIVNVNSGECLQVAGASYADHTKLVQALCKPLSAVPWYQNFQLFGTPASGNDYIQPNNSGEVIFCTGTANNTPVETEYAENSNAYWSFDLL